MTWKKHLKTGTDFASEKAKEAGDKAKEVGSKAGEVVDNAVKKYDDSVIKEKIDVVSDATTNQLDVISGQKMYDLVQESIELQNNINDVLASKLHEALKRIEVLEKKVNG